MNDRICPDCNGSKRPHAVKCDDCRTNDIIKEKIEEYKKGENK